MGCHAAPFPVGVPDVCNTEWYSLHRVIYRKYTKEVCLPRKWTFEYVFPLPRSTDFVKQGNAIRQYSLVVQTLTLN